MNKEEENTCMNKDRDGMNKEKEGNMKRKRKEEKMMYQCYVEKREKEQEHHGTKKGN